MNEPELTDCIHELLDKMRVPLEHVDLDSSKHVGMLLRELGSLNKGHPHLDEILGLLKRHRYVNLP